MKETYKGYVIEFNEHREKWEIIDKEGETIFEHTSLKVVKSRIDQFVKRQQKKEFNRFKIIINEGFNKTKLVIATVTSIFPGGCWITYEGTKNREKIKEYKLQSSVYVDNDANRLIYDAFMENKKRIDELIKDNEKLINQLEPVELKKFGIDDGY